MRYVYIGHFGYPYRLTVAQWRTLCEGGARGEGYDLEQIGAKELKRFPAGVVKFDRQSPGRSSIYTDLLYYEPLDWEAEAFADALVELRETLTAPHGWTAGRPAAAGHEGGARVREIG